MAIISGSGSGGSGSYTPSWMRGRGAGRNRSKKGSGISGDSGKKPWSVNDVFASTKPKLPVDVTPGMPVDTRPRLPVPQPYYAGGGDLYPPRRDATTYERPERSTYVPSWYQAAGGASSPEGTRYSTRGGRDEGGYSIPAPYVQEPVPTSEYMPTSMPIIEREMDWLNQNVASPYLPSWVFDEGGGGRDWWGNYRKRRGGGGGGWGSGGSYLPNFYTGLYMLNANR